MALSGGRTPLQMLRALASENVPWARVHVAQVDERVAPSGDPERNLTHLRESLLAHAPLPAENLHAMPVEEARHLGVTRGQTVDGCQLTGPCVEGRRAVSLVPQASARARHALDYLRVGERTRRSGTTALPARTPPGVSFL